MGRAFVRGALVLAALLALPAGAGAVTYGLGDSAGAFAHCAGAGAGGTCPAGGYWNDARFRALTGPASAHRITQVRFFVAYDALAEWNGSRTTPGCIPSRVLTRSWTDGAGRPHAAGESWRDLLAGLTAARADGLSPMVAIAGYGSPSATPAWDAPAPDPTTVAGRWAYRCGVRGLLGAVGGLPAAEQPHVWEAFNEPDAFAVYNGAGRRDSGTCAAGASAVDGAAKAACDYTLAIEEIHGVAGHGQDTVIAGALSHPSTAYLAAYAQSLGAQRPGFPLPSVWSVHDYDDVTGSYAGPALGPLQAFDLALAADTYGDARQLWITEAGTQLTDTAPAPAPAQCGSPAPAAGAPTLGAPTLGALTLGAPTLGACVDGRPARQAAAAAGFFDLPAAGIAVPITHLFWYQWQGEPTWDSGIVDSHGVPRAPWCAFAGRGTCPGSPAAAVSSPAATS